MTGEGEDKFDEIFKIFKELSHLPIRGWNEENVKMRIVIPFLKALGYSDQKLDLEYHYGTDRPDIIVNDPSFPLVVEVKGTNVNLNRHITQIERYSYAFSSYLAILTNGNRFYIFSPFWRRRAFEDKIILSFTLEDLDKQSLAEKLKMLFSVSEGKKRLEYLRSIEEEIMKAYDQVDKLDEEISYLEEEKRIIEKRYPEGIEELKKFFDHLGSEVKEDIEKYLKVTERIKNLKAEKERILQEIPSIIITPSFPKGKDTKRSSRRSNEEFRMGIVDEVINIRALQLGKQIVLCKSKKKSNKSVFILPKTTFRSDYTPSEPGRKLIYEPIDSSVCKHVAKLEYLEIPGRSRKFWEELYEMGEFNLWEIDEGPFKYFENVPPRNRLFWILRVYKMPFGIIEGVDFTPPHMLNSKIINGDTLHKIQQGFSNGDFKPVISDNQFEKRVEDIKKTANKYFNR